TRPPRAWRRSTETARRRGWAPARAGPSPGPRPKRAREERDVESRGLRIVCEDRQLEEYRKSRALAPTEISLCYIASFLERHDKRESSEALGRRGPRRRRAPRNRRGRSGTERDRIASRRTRRFRRGVRHDRAWKRRRRASRGRGRGLRDAVRRRLLGGRGPR